MHVNLCDLVEDIARNACASGAETVEIEITEIASQFRFSVRDNGKGMSRDEAQKVRDPRMSSGMGIPFLIETVKEAAGGWDMHTEKGAGTAFTVWFDLENPETPPVGDVARLLRCILVLDGPKEIIIKRLRRGAAGNVRYELRKSEIAEAVGGFEDAGSLTLLASYLKKLESPEQGAPRS